MIRLAEQHPDWVVGFADECWWSRFAQPALQTFAPVQAPLRLIEQERPKADSDPKARACYGVLLRCGERSDDQLWLRFADSRPVSALTTQFLGWCSARLAAQGKTALLLVWDNASWHGSQAVQRWIAEQNAAVQAGQQVGVRIVVCPLPTKSPWLNPIEPKWVHGKRRVVEANRRLSADELEQRVLETFGCEPTEHLTISVMVT